MSRLALGSAAFGLDYGISNRRGKVSQEEVSAILAYACSQGIDCIDTSPLYGESEAVLGAALKNMASEQFKLVSKLPGGATVGTIDETIAKSLERLGQNSIFGYLIHDFASYRTNPQLFERIRERQEQGVFRKIGFSLYYPSELDMLLDNAVEFQIIQVPYSLVDRRFESYFETLSKRGVEIHVRSVFLQGLFFLNPDELPAHFRGIADELRRFHLIVEQDKRQAADVCLGFALSNPSIARVVVGVDSLDNLRMNRVHEKSHSETDPIYEKLEFLSCDDESILIPSAWPV
jgi:aryl-alcohol dehydrogenase-like predicted oxidoreductase